MALTKVTSHLMSDDQTSEIDRKSYSIPCDINGENPIRQAYEHLKTLPEFSGATDI